MLRVKWGLSSFRLRVTHWPRALWWWPDLGGWALHTSRCGAPSESLTWSDLTTKWKLSDFWSHLVLVNEILTMLVTLLLRCKWSNDLDRHLGIINQNKSSIPLTQTAVSNYHSLTFRLKHQVQVLDSHCCLRLTLFIHSVDMPSSLLKQNALWSGFSRAHHVLSKNKIFNNNWCSI